MILYLILFMKSIFMMAVSGELDAMLENSKYNNQNRALYKTIQQSIFLYKKKIQSIILLENLNR